MNVLRLWLPIAVAALLAGPAAGGDRPIRVGTSGDYAPFSVISQEHPIVFDGFDLAVARAFAEERGRTLVPKRFVWPELLRGLESNRFDVAMSGVTITPDRSAVGRFSVPVIETGAVVLSRDPGKYPDVASLDTRVARIGVNAGGYLERVARAHFPRATLIAIPDNASVLNALLAESVDAVVTDTAEAPAWLTMVAGASVLGPITRDRKGYLVRADQPELAAELDDWLLAREADGTLAAVREVFFGEGAGEPIATPLLALLAGVDERLSLMPLIAVAKRNAGAPLVVPRREAIVLDAAVRSVAAAAAARGVDVPDEALVRGFFRAQIEASKQLQRAALDDPRFDRPETTPDVDTVLRPALIRIGDKIARLVVALPPGLAARDVLAATRDQLRTPWLSAASVEAIAASVSALSSAPDQ